MAAKVFPKHGAVHRVWQAVGYGLVFLAFLYIVYVAPNYMVTKFSIGVAYSLAILGLNLVTGYSGQVSLGHSAFFGVGAYTTAILMVDHNWSFWATIPVAAALGILVGYAVGIPALRVRGLYLSLITLALAIVFPVLAKEFDGLTGGANGKVISGRWDPPGWIPGDITDSDWKFITIAFVAAVGFLLCSNMVRSRVGRGLIALRDNPTGAAVSGVYPAGFKTTAFAASAMVGAVAGSLYALAVGTLSPDSFGLIRSIEFIAGLIVGGVATIIGSLVGGMIIEFLPYYTSEFLEGPRANILLGAFLILVIFVAPGGIMYLVRKWRAKVVMFLPKLPTVAPAPVSAGESAPAAEAVAASASSTQGGTS
jgi:branched-chain amino acid transport system permease protein